MASLLLVDDDPHMGVIVRLLCRRGGDRVRYAADAAAGWRLLHEEEAPDLVLLDVNLGGESGVSLCRRIRSAPASAGQKVALFTQWGMTNDIVAGLDAGADFLVCKDLVSDPPRWQSRMGEILAGYDSLAASNLLGSGKCEKERMALSEWVERVNRAVSAALPVPALAVQTVLLRRSLVEAGGCLDATGPPAEQERSGSWFGQAEGRLVVGQRRSVLPVSRGKRLLASLARQGWCLLGGAESEEFRRTLGELAGQYHFGRIVPGS